MAVQSVQQNVQSREKQKQRFLFFRGPDLGSSGKAEGEREERGEQGFLPVASGSRALNSRSSSLRRSRNRAPNSRNAEHSTNPMR